MARAATKKKTKKSAAGQRKAKKFPKRKKAKAKSKKKKTKATKKKTKKKKAIRKKASKRRTKAKTKKKAAKKKTAKKKTTKKKTAKKTAKKAAKKKTKAIKSKETDSAALRLVETPKITTGDKAPEFTLFDQNGTTHSLSQYLGKNVVLYFYPKDDTPGCTTESCSFRDHLGEFEDKNAVILGVSLDDQASHNKFIEKYSLNFPLLCDTEATTSKAYGCYVQKNMYGNLKWGIERATFVIDTKGNIAESFRKVKVDGHTQEVLDVLNKLS